MRRIKTAVALLVCCAAVASAQDGTAAQPDVQPNRPRMIRVAGGVMLGLIEHKALPEYPTLALTAGLQGDVIFKILVDETGKILLSEPVDGNPVLVGASVDALRNFRFRPYLLNGSPIRVESQLGFHFTVSKKGDSTNGQVECMSTIAYRPEFRAGVLTNEGASVLWPRKVSGADPQVPPELAGKSGSVYLTITIGEDGKVQDVKVLGGDQPFVDIVVAAAKQFVYEPQLVDGKPSVATTQASYHFGTRR